MKKPRWDREQFVSLLLQIEPSVFDERIFELAAPYSEVGSRVMALARQIDKAVTDRKLSFPNSPARLRAWALKNCRDLPQAMRLPTKESSDVKTVRQVSTAVKVKIREIVEKTASDNSFSVTKNRLRGMVQDIFGVERLSEHAFDREVWKQLPAKIKLKGGKPTAEYDETWSSNVLLLREKLSQLKPST